MNKKEKSENIGVSATPSLVHDIDAARSKYGLSRSAWVRVAIVRELERVNGQATAVSPKELEY